ncbi:MAG: amidohydrolase family protein [Bifidobacteriaceae bacterium]|jgi:imidazolonepropionase-like amidohydrolase|nr:amidohydrolase family protein [Bifidobacteriaceae bacterium]
MAIDASRALDQTLPPPPDRVLTADRLFTGASTSHIESGALALSGGKVAWAGVERELPPAYQDWPRTAYPGATILPGFIETHAHLGLYSWSAQPAVPDPAVHSAAWEALSSVKIARQLASVGVTTVQSLGADYYGDVALREAVKLGLIQGPRIVAVGAPITYSGGHSWQRGSVADSIPEILRQVRLHHQAGTDGIKVMATGGFMSFATAPWNAQFTVDELKALIDDAHRLGKHVAAHAHGTDGIRRLVEAGIDYITHATFVGRDGTTEFDPDLADQIAAKGIYVDGCAPPSYPPVAGETATPRAAQLYQHGAKIVTGHDIGAVYPASAYTFGLKQLEASGLPRAEVLIAATSRGAGAVGLAGVTGVLAPTYSADLVVAKGDPLVSLDALDNLVEVIIEGRTFEREWLEPFDPASRFGRPPERGQSPADHRAVFIERRRRAAAHPFPRAN